MTQLFQSLQQTADLPVDAHPGPRTGPPEYKGNADLCSTSGTRVSGSPGKERNDTVTGQRTRFLDVIYKCVGSQPLRKEVWERTIRDRD